MDGKCIVKNFNSLMELRDYINSHGIVKENIVNVFTNDGQFSLIYYEYQN